MHRFTNEQVAVVNLGVEGVKVTCQREDCEESGRTADYAKIPVLSL
jgi:hypothetical protein